MLKVKKWSKPYLCIKDSKRLKLLSDSRLSSRSSYMDCSYWDELDRAVGKSNKVCIDSVCSSPPLILYYTAASKRSSAETNGSIHIIHSFSFHTSSNPQQRPLNSKFLNGSCNPRVKTCRTDPELKLPRPLSLLRLCSSSASFESMGNSIDTCTAWWPRHFLP